MDDIYSEYNASLEWEQNEQDRLDAERYRDALIKIANKEGGDLTGKACRLIAEKALDREGGQ
jgi:hypothetical protein